MNLVLIRHCETDWNAEGRLQGTTDIELSRQGISHANNLGKCLIGVGITQIVSSDLKRSTQTANIIKTYLRVSLEVDARLRECHFGELEGMTWLEIEQKYRVPKLSIFAGVSSNYSFRKFGGENKNAVTKRHIDLLDELKVRYPQEKVLLVGHGTGLNTVLNWLKYQANLERNEYRSVEY